MKLLWLAPVLMTAVAGLTGTLWLHGPAADRRNVGAATPSRVAANGIVEGARPEIALRPEIAGNIVRIPYRENDAVQSGDLLVELRNDAQKCQVDLARANLAEARADYQQCKAESDRTQRLGVAVASRERLDADHFKVLKAQAKLDEADARLRLAQAELAKTRLSAPSAGRILRVYAEPGEQVRADGAQPVLLLADDSRRRVRAFIDELDGHRVRVGQEVQVTCDGLPERIFVGRVAQVLPRMGKRALSTDAPEEYKDVYSREVLIDLEAGAELALNLRVRVVIQTPTAEER